MSERSPNKIHRNKLASSKQQIQLSQTEFSNLLEILRVELTLSNNNQLKQPEFEKIVELIRSELRLSFWQGVALSLFIFILSLFVTVLAILLQK